MKEQFAVFGSDARQAAAGRALARAGYAVGGAEQLATADYLLLPMPLDAQQLGLCRLLRAAKPVVIALSTNDGLAASGENIARLAQRKHYFFVPYGQDDWLRKPQSLKARLELLPATLDAALQGRQLQPLLREPLSGE